MHNHGHAAIYTDPNTGEKVSETFKSYSRVEIEVALAAMALDTEDTGRSLTFAHPLFIASDPNLYYPCVWYHGSEGSPRTRGAKCGLGGALRPAARPGACPGFTPRIRFQGRPPGEEVRRRGLPPYRVC